MTLTLLEYQRRKQVVADLEHKESRLAGAMDQLQARLAELGCSSLDDAKRILGELGFDLDKKQKEAERLWAEFEQTYGGRLRTS